MKSNRIPRQVVWVTLVGVLVAALLGLGSLANAAPITSSRKPTGQATRAKTRLPKQAPTSRPAPAATAEPAPVDAQNTDDQNGPAPSPVSPGPMTSQILLFNPDTTGAATVQVDVYDATGAVATTLSATVAKNGYKLLALPGSLGSNFKGGAVVSSDKNVQAIVVDANSTQTARDAYEGVLAPATDVTLPLVRHLAPDTPDTQNTILAIQNTTGNSADVTATFYDPTSGLPSAQHTCPQLAGHASCYIDTKDVVFPSGTFTGTARITSNPQVAVAVAAQSRYYKDTAAFHGTTTADQDTVLYLPEALRKFNASNAAVNWSEIFVRNNGANPTNVTLDFYTAAGTLVTSQTANNVAKDGMAQFLLNDPAFAALGTSFSGWAKLSSSGEPISATGLSVLNKGNRLSSVDALPGAKSRSKYVCGDASRQATQYSRITVLNTDSTLTATAKILLYAPDTGAKLLVYKVKIAPNASASVSLADAAFAAAGTGYEGMAIVQAGGTNPPKLAVTVSNPYGNPKLKGTTGYLCSGIP